MTQAEAIMAYKVLASLSREKLPVKTAYALFRLKKALQPAYDFMAEQERAVCGRYDASVDDKGIIRPKDPEKTKAMLEELNALKDMEYAEKPERIEVDMPDGLCVTMEQIEALEPVVVFRG